MSIVASLSLPVAPFMIPKLNPVKNRKERKRVYKEVLSMSRMKPVEKSYS